MGALLYFFGMLSVACGILSILLGYLRLLYVAFETVTEKGQDKGVLLLYLILPFMLIHFIFNNWKEASLPFSLCCFGLTLIFIGSLSVGFAWYF